MRVFLANRGNFKHQNDEGETLNGTPQDAWHNVKNLERARKKVTDYVRENALETENWFGGHLIIGGVYEGCFDYEGKFHRTGTQYADYRLVWLQSYQAKIRIRRLSQMN